MSVRIVIADDHEIVRQGVRRILETHPEWEICAEAENGQKAVTSGTRTEARRHHYGRLDARHERS